MKYAEAKSGRVFVIRLEDGDILHEEIEQFAKEKEINAAYLTVLGGGDRGSVLITGPKDGRSKTIVPQEECLEDVHEVAGTGTLFPNEQGETLLHMHLACGRGDSTITGCVRRGVKVWQVMEVILHELVDSTGVRRPDPATGFELLIP